MQVRARRSVAFRLYFNHSGFKLNGIAAIWAFNVPSRYNAVLSVRCGQRYDWNVCYSNMRGIIVVFINLYTIIYNIFKTKQTSVHRHTRYATGIHWTNLSCISGTSTFWILELVCYRLSSHTLSAGRF
mgnify:CR=1 FL=1